MKNNSHRKVFLLIFRSQESFPEGCRGGCEYERIHRVLGFSAWGWGMGMVNPNWFDPCFFAICNARWNKLFFHIVFFNNDNIKVWHGIIYCYIAVLVL